MTRYKQHYFLTFLLLFAFCRVSLAQFQVVPLKNTEKSKPSSAKVAALSLPFFDDFSTSTNTQDLSKWQKGGGVYINNVFTTNHPTLNIATFDGLQANGLPYDFSNSFAEGATDTLTSLPIDLSTKTIADSVYLSFFYKTQGLGDKPELRDSLRLQFLTNGDKWQTVWVGLSDTIRTTNTLFKQVIIPIRANLYLHNKFQFSFQSFGKKSGQFDVWHLDYVYIDEIKSQLKTGEVIRNISVRNPVNKEVTAILTQDLATQSPLTSLLKRYNAMPLRQLLVNPQKELVDSITWRVSNLSNLLRFFPYNYRVTNLLNNTVLQTSSSREGIGSQSALVIKQLNNLNSALLTNNKLKLKVAFEITTSDVFPFTMNDSISRVVDLDNYYAYDDGTAEQAAYLGKGLGRAAVQFVVNKPDAVTAIRINIQPTVTNLTGKRLVFQILANDRGKPGKALKTISDSTMVIKYPNTPNAFIEYKIDSVIVVDTFYVGYLQLADDEPLTIGLDNNSPQFANRHFYNISNEWIRVTDAQATALFTPIKGSLMIRPVMAGKTITILSNEGEIEEKSLIIYPNPSSNIFRWNDSRLKNVEIIDLTGRTVFQTVSDNQEVNLQHLNSGTYLLRLSNDKNIFVRKIVKE